VRTTVDIPDPLYRELKSSAAREGTSVKDLIVRGVKKELKKTRRSVKPLILPVVPSKRPGTLDIDNAKIAEVVPFP
jgi:hypothetical protein